MRPFVVDLYTFARMNREQYSKKVIYYGGVGHVNNLINMYNIIGIVNFQHYGTFPPDPPPLTHTDLQNTLHVSMPVTNFFGITYHNLSKYIDKSLGELEEALYKNGKIDNNR